VIGIVVGGFIGGSGGWIGATAVYLRDSFSNLLKSIIERLVFSTIASASPSAGSSEKSSGERGLKRSFTSMIANHRGRDSSGSSRVRNVVKPGARRPRGSGA